MLLTSIKKESVTVKLGIRPDSVSIFNEGQIVRIKRMKNKRIFGKIVNVNGNEFEHKITLRPIYMLSPKSTLWNKSRFTKHKKPSFI